MVGFLHADGTHFTVVAACRHDSQRSAVIEAVSSAGYIVLNGRMIRIGTDLGGSSHELMCGIVIAFM
jgi:hypothetical protein